MKLSHDRIYSLTASKSPKVPESVPLSLETSRNYLFSKLEEQFIKIHFLLSVRHFRKRF